MIIMLWDVILVYGRELELRMTIETLVGREGPIYHFILLYLDDFYKLIIIININI